MTLTTHGHHIPFSPTDDEPPVSDRKIARCGGPNLCRRCAREAGAKFAEIMINDEGLVQHMDAVSAYPPQADIDEALLSENIKSEMIPLKLVAPRDPTRKVLEEIFVERQKQKQLGYHDEHDDHHGPSHFYRELTRRIYNLRGSQGPQRTAVLKLAALCVALLEYWDRRESGL